MPLSPFYFQTVTPTFSSIVTIALSAKPREKTCDRRDESINLADVLPTPEEEVQIHGIIEAMDEKALHNKMVCLAEYAKKHIQVNQGVKEARGELRKAYLLNQESSRQQVRILESKSTTCHNSLHQIEAPVPQPLQRRLTKKRQRKAKEAPST